jgi:hypothetical protein
LITDFTEKALVSHFPKKDKNGNLEDCSLLAKMLGKVNVFLDLSPVLSFNKLVRGKVFNTLRAAYDGDEQFFSGIGSRPYCGKFVIIGAITPAVEQYRALDMSLGERFLYLRTHVPKEERKSTVKRSIDNSFDKERLREELRVMVHEFVSGVELYKNVTESEKEHIVDIADFLAYARTHVPRHSSRWEEITAEPEPEVGTRCGDQLLQLYSACVGIMGRDEGRLAINRVVRDTIPSLRTKVLRYIARYGLATVSDFNHFKVHPNTIRRTLGDLEALDILEVNRVKTGERAEKVYSAATEFERLIPALYETGEKQSKMWG